MSVDDKTLKQIQEKVSAAVIDAFAQYTNHMPDMTGIIWLPKIGARGSFELADGKANVNNAPFQRLTAYLKSHDGKATIDSYFVWLFTDGSGSIGRKQKA